jgi:hypothetical protein
VGEVEFVAELVDLGLRVFAELVDLMLKRSDTPTAAVKFSTLIGHQLFGE